MKDLTAEQIAALPWAPGEKFALANKETLTIEYGSDDKAWLQGLLQRMTPTHPKYPKLQLVTKPESIASDKDKMGFLLVI